MTLLLAEYHYFRAYWRLISRRRSLAITRNPRMRHIGGHYLDVVID